MKLTAQNYILLATDGKPLVYWQLTAHRYSVLANRWHIEAVYWQLISHHYSVPDADGTPLEYTSNSNTVTV